MAEELISKKTRTEFREHFVGWTLATIADEFDAMDIRCDASFQPPCGGARRSLVEQYYHTLNFTNAGDVKRVLRVFEAVLQNIDHNLQHPGQYADKSILERERLKLTSLLKRDGWEYIDGELQPKAGKLAFADLEQHVARFDLDHIRREIERLKQSVETDPAQAIGTAKELVESCCKTILSECNVEIDRHSDLVPLVKATAKALKLTPDDVDDAKRGADIIRQLLHKLSGIVNELGQLRNLYGTGHGKNGRTKTLQPRHARLAVGFASTLALFLFETHVERTEAKPVSRGGGAVGGYMAMGGHNRL